MEGRAGGELKGKERRAIQPKKMILFLFILSSLTSQLNGENLPACPSMSKSFPPNCLSFYSNKSAIKVPVDTAIVKFGLLRDTFVTRDGESFSVAKDVKLPKYQRASEGEEWILRATLSGSKVSKIEPWLHVPLSTKLLKLRNSTFEGTISALGGEKSSWLRIDFSNLVIPKVSMSTFVTGSIVNLDKSVKSLVNGKYVCQKSLYGSSTSKLFLAPVVGLLNSVQIYWDPAMHSPGDSEIVLVLSSGVSYMTRTQSVLNLMVEKERVEQSVFMIHGNPMFVPAEIKGVWKKKMSLEYC